jgi:glycosyltransferase involved in cell wall biosynthesis
LISIVIPALNEEGSIATTLQEFSAVLSAMRQDGAEIIVVDDGSSDRTASIASEHGAKVIRHPHNLGYGGALKSGIRAARHDVIVIADADRTYPVDKLPALMEQYRQGFDMVIGARTGAHYRESITKSALRWILTFLVQFTTGRKVIDVNSGFRVFSKATVMPYFVHLCDTFSFTTSLTLAYMMTGRFVGYVPIPYDAREGTSKVRVFRDSLRTLEYIILSATYFDPMKLFALFSAICVVLSFAGFGISFLLGIRGGYLLGLGGLLVALMIFSIGLLASLLKQIMDRQT